MIPASKGGILFKLFFPGCCTAETQSGNRMFPIQMPYIPSQCCSTANSCQIPDQASKNSTKVTQHSPNKINLIWKNRLGFLLSRISSLVQLTADMWEFVTCHSLGAGTASWDGSGCIHNADFLLHPVREVCSRVLEPWLLRILHFLW